MRRNKFNAVKVKATDGGKDFDSKGEAARYEQLLWLQKAGKIRALERQVSFPLALNGEFICKFIADFIYEQDNKFIAEDFKGFLTPVSRLKHKMFRAYYKNWTLLVTKK